jgi:hypothetical protein
MKLSTSLRFILILIAIGAIIALVAFAVSLGQGGGTSNNGASGKTNPFSALFPFLAETKPSPGETGSGDTATTPGGSVPRLHQITASPVSGAHFTDDGTVRYVEKETGHVFDVRPDSFESVRISNTTLPGIQRIIWAGNTKFVAQSVRGGESIQNILAEVATSTAESALAMSPLGGFKRVAASIDGTTLLAVTETGDGSRIESATLGKALSVRPIMYSPTRSWIPLIAGRDFMLATAPSDGVPGFLYLIESAGIGAKIVGNVPGLMALPSPDGRYIAYSWADGGRLSLSTLDRKTGTVSVVPTGTLAEKCAWFPAGEERLFCGIPKNAGAVRLDAWLLGLGNFNDDAWAVNPTGAISSRIADLADESGARIDVINPAVSPDGAYAIFQNKTDLSLWALRLAQ